MMESRSGDALLLFGLGRFKTTIKPQEFDYKTDNDVIQLFMYWVYGTTSVRYMY